MPDYYLRITTMSGNGNRRTENLVSPLNHIQGVYNLEDAKKYLKSYYVEGVLQQFIGYIDVFVNDKKILLVTFHEGKLKEMEEVDRDWETPST